MSRLQNVSREPDTQVLPALIAANSCGQDKPGRREPETVPFTKAELRQMILDIMG
jgi:hypothetical protein